MNIPVGNRQLPTSLEEIFQAATAAAEDTSLSGENTVLGDVRFNGRKGQTLKDFYFLDSF